MERKLQESTTVDVVFLMSCSESMVPFLDAVKKRFFEFLANLHELNPNMVFRVAFIGYGDYGVIVELPFTTPLEFTTCLTMQKVYNGGNGAEDVLGGLSAVCGLDWKSGSRVLYHSGALPCYGRAFHSDSCSDAFPEGDPGGLNAGDLLRELAQKGVKYFFGRVRDTTDKMIEQFNQLAVALPALFVFVENINIRNVKVPAISAPRVSKGGNVLQRERDIHVDVHPPAWSGIPFENAMRFSMIVDNASDLLTNDRCVNDFPEAMPVSIKMAPKAFAKGVLRTVHYGQLINLDGTVYSIILKQSLAVRRTKLDCEKLLLAHRAAKYLAVEFNKIKPKHCPSIEYVNAHILQLMTRWPEQPCVICEQSIPGHFEKYNNSTGYCAMNPMLESGVNHDAIQAFSHWTYCATNKQLMVVDCQGAFDSTTNSFLLTDPAVHTANIRSVLRFGNRNNSNKGFADFMTTHICNKYCHALFSIPQRKFSRDLK